jgi:hypothetical protein
MPDRLPAQGVPEAEGLGGECQIRQRVRFPASIETVIQYGKTEPGQMAAYLVAETPAEQETEIPAFFLPA